MLDFLKYVSLPENIYDTLPPIFHIDDFEKCKNEDKLFCKTNINLRPSGRNISNHWKLIQVKIYTFILKYGINLLFW